MKKTHLIFIFIMSLAWSVSCNIIHPITTDYVHSLNLPTFYFGIFFSLMSLGQVIGAVFFGKLSDKLGRKLLLCIGVAGYGIFQFCFGFINTNPLLILVFRVLGGFFAAAPVTLFVTFALDNTTGNKRVNTLALLASLKYLGEAIGYFIGGQLFTTFNLSFQQVFLIQVFVCFSVSILSYFLLGKETKGEVDNNTFTSLKNVSALNLTSVLFLLSIFLIAMGQININKYFDVYFIDLGYSAGALGSYVLVTGIIGFLGSLFILPLFKKDNNKVSVEFLLGTLILSSAILVGLTFNLPIAIFIPLIYSTHLVYVVCRICATSLQQSYLSKSVSKENYGLIMGIMQSILSLGNVVAPLLGSIIYKEKDVLVFNIAGLLIFLSFVILLIVFRRNKKQSF